MLGDSLSAAYGIELQQGWVNLLAERLVEHNPSYAVINASISGETTSGGRARLGELLTEHRPDWVILELGGNDGLRGFPLKVTEQNLEQMVAMAQAAGARVLLLGMQLPPNYGVAYTRAFSAIYQRIADSRDALLVPFFLQGVGGHRELMQRDGIHPTAAAQPTLLQNVWSVLAPALE